MSRSRQRTERKQSPKVPLQTRSLLTHGLRGAATCALVFCAALVVYRPAFQGALLWDDNMHVTRAELRPLHGLWRIWFDLGATQQYYPLLHSAFWLEHRLWGGAVLGYPLVNVLEHVLAACLLVALLRRLAIP